MNRVHFFLNWLGLLFMAMLITFLYLDAGIYAGLDNLLKGLLLLFYIALAGRFAFQIAKALQEDEERHAITKTPMPPASGEVSENGVEPFGKRDTTAYLINKGRHTRW